MIIIGWVAYSVKAVVAAVGENRLMPKPDCNVKVINAETGYVRDNTSWVIGRIVRDFERWMDDGKGEGKIHTHLDGMLQTRLKEDRHKAKSDAPGTEDAVERRSQTGLCVSIYKAEQADLGHPAKDFSYWIGFFTSVFQLGLAAIPIGLFGDWGIMLVTVIGIILSFFTGSIPQWKKEKWACRKNTTKTVILTKGNGSQHAIVVFGDEKGLDLEDLAAGPTNVNVSSSYATRLLVITLAILWILLLVTAAGIKQNTWFLLAIGGVGILQNIFVAGYRRFPQSFGVPLHYEGVIGETTVMATLFAVEDAYPRVGRSMRETFFPGKLRPDEDTRWNTLEAKADALDKARKEAKKKA